MMPETVEIEVNGEDVAREVAYGIIGRAQQIHDNPDDEYEWCAEELRDVGHDLLDEYEGVNERDDE